MCIRCVLKPTRWWSTLVCCYWPSPTQMKSTAGTCPKLAQKLLQPCIWHILLTNFVVIVCFCRPNTYHSNLQVSWDLNTGVCCTVGVGDLTEVRGQTRWGTSVFLLLSCQVRFGSVALTLSICICFVSGSVWSSYRKSCVNMVMKWLVPESSSRYINRMTNEALHKGELFTCEHTFTVLIPSSKPLTQWFPTLL